jgi:hypothetical protein
MANMNQAFRKQIRLNVIISGVVAGLGVFAAWTYLLTERTIGRVAIAAAGAAGAGVIFSLMFKPTFMKELLKQQRKVMREQFGGKDTIGTELELRADAVWVRQAGIELTFPWTICTAVRDNAGDVEIDFTQGICVVRDRDFPSAADRQEFLAIARRLAGR